MARPLSRILVWVLPQPRRTGGGKLDRVDAVFAGHHAMSPQSQTRPLYRTDRIRWTRDTLQARIRENERLIARIGDDPQDDDYLWIRSVLEDDLRAKRDMLRAYSEE